MTVTVKREVILRSIVTDQLKEELAEELQHAADELEQRIEQLDFSARGYITELQRADLQQAVNLRKRVEAEKKRQQELRDGILERKQQVQVLDNGTEIIRGSLESFVELSEGDDLRVLLTGTEIVTKDGIVIEIRERVPLAEDETPVVAIETDLGTDSDNA